MNYSHMELQLPFLRPFSPFHFWYLKSLSQIFLSLSLSFLHISVNLFLSPRLSIFFHKLCSSYSTALFLSFPLLIFEYIHHADKMLSLNNFETLWIQIEFLLVCVQCNWRYTIQKMQILNWNCIPCIYLLNFISIRKSIFLQYQTQNKKWIQRFAQKYANFSHVWSKVFS